jgi:hypothetical protein
MSADIRVRELVQKLITEGDAVIASKWQPGGNWITGPPTYVDLEMFQQWRGRCRLLLTLLGPLAGPWEPVLGSTMENKFTAAKSTQGALKGIQQSIDEGLLVRFEDLVLAEAFSDLSEQAGYLFGQGYFLAAGVIARAVLEERLRRLATVNACLPTRARPTLADFNGELYKKGVYDKVAFKHVESLAAVGNEAAHASPDLKMDDVRRLLDGLQDFLTRFSV